MLIEPSLAPKKHHFSMAPLGRLCEPFEGPNALSGGDSGDTTSPDQKLLLMIQARTSVPWNTTENASEDPQRHASRDGAVIAAPIIIAAVIVAAAPTSVTAVITIVAAAMMIIVTYRATLIATEPAVAVGTMESAIMETAAVKSSTMKTTP